MNSFANTIYFLSIFCISLILANNLRHLKRMEKCSKIVCPLVKATICVKVKDQNTPRRHVMMSKCELKLIKCHGDVNTTVVPGKYCNALRQGNILPGKEEDPVNDSSPKILQGDSPVVQEDPVNDSAPRDRVDQEDPVNDSDPKDRVDQEDPVNDSGPKDGVDQEDPVNDSSPSKIQQEENPVDDEDPGKDSDTSGISKEEDHVGQQEVANESDNDDVPRVEGDNDGEKRNDQSGADCPQKCQNRRVMVCARCPHGIYRTFMSSCFMRMYQCQHPNEKLELVSRHACTGSAPYMGEMPKSIGENVEPYDEDPVLNHIYHRLSVQD
ncbi:uncharacterized protein LOC134791883 [Cydia splendana]|uniref:uncharacterized protein LOC134791883 n=1 Tax=Cydia splendana TaxID=1100963 RepID=UPI0028F47742